MITVVTAFTANYEEYGQEFLNCFFRYWPQVNFICYVEEPVNLEWGELRYLKDIPGYIEFMGKHDSPRKNGLEPNKYWSSKEVEQGYSYRYNARKFALQGFVPHHAAQGLEGTMIWLDADVFAYRPVTAKFLKKLIKKEITYLGRKGTHSEIGFVAYKLPEALPYIKKFHDYYDKGTVFRMKEWHSAYVFDQATKEADRHNLSPTGHGHVWYQTPLSLVMDHAKGKRKDQGGSKEKRKWADKLLEQFGDYLC